MFPGIHPQLFCPCSRRGMALSPSFAFVLLGGFYCHHPARQASCARGARRTRAAHPSRWMCSQPCPRAGGHPPTGHLAFPGVAQNSTPKHRRFARENELFLTWFTAFRNTALLRPGKERQTRGVVTKQSEGKLKPTCVLDPSQREGV